MQRCGLGVMVWVGTPGDGISGGAATAHPGRDSERGAAILCTLLQRMPWRDRMGRWSSGPIPAHATSRSHAHGSTAWRALPSCRDCGLYRRADRGPGPWQSGNAHLGRALWGDGRGRLGWRGSGRRESPRPHRIPPISPAMTAHNVRQCSRTGTVCRTQHIWQKDDTGHAASPSDSRRS